MGEKNFLDTMLMREPSSSHKKKVIASDRFPQYLTEFETEGRNEMSEIICIMENLWGDEATIETAERNGISGFQIRAYEIRYFTKTYEEAYDRLYQLGYRE